MKTVLDMHVRVAEGQESAAAKQLAEQVQGAHWQVLAALASEIVFEHERRNAGARVIVVAGPESADRVLADLSGTVRAVR